MPKNFTIFLDIDGCIIEHCGNATKQLLNNEPKLLPGSLEAINYWERNGDQIILTTSRKESLRGKTERDLEKLGIVYDKLIMGLNVKRVVVNDVKPETNIKTAYAKNLVRNKGIQDFKFQDDEIKDEI